MHYNITTKIIVIILLFLFTTLGFSYYFLNSEVSFLSEKLGTKLAIEKINYNNYYAISKLNRELALVNKMAHSNTILDWIQNENDKNFQKKAFEELESFRTIFSEKSYFLVTKNSKTYYYNDANAAFTNKEKQFILDEHNPKDAWFFETIKSGKEVSLNVDSNQHLGVIKVWINQIAYDHNRNPVAVLGTGIDLTDFIKNVLKTNDQGIENFFIDGNGNIQASKNLNLIDFATISNKHKHKNFVDLLTNQINKDDFKSILELLKKDHDLYKMLKVNINGEEKLLTISKIENIDWYIVSIVEFDKLVSENHFNNIIFVIMISFVLFVFLTSFSVNFIIIQPIKRLHKIVDKVMHGNFNIEFKIRSSDEIGKLCEHFRDMIKQIEEHTKSLETKVKKRTEQLYALLDNSEEGFLSFDNKLVIESGYSKECVSIFEQEINGQNIIDLLFHNDNNGHDLASTAFEEILKTNDFDMKEMYLSLIPTQINIHNKTIGIRFKIISDEKYMAILSNITDKIELEKEVERQQQIQKMIIAVISNKNEFCKIKNEFFQFINSTQQTLANNQNSDIDLVDILRQLHTFKGIFAQKECMQITNTIHALEAQIKQHFEHKTLNNQIVYQLLKNANMIETLNHEINEIFANFGGKCSINDASVEVSIQELNEISEALLDLSRDISKIDKQNLNELGLRIHNFSEISVKDMLKDYSLHSQIVAKNLGKRIYPFKIYGDDKILANTKIKPFMQTLVHLFRNSIDHGIENEDIRFQLNKDPNGTIACDFKLENNTFILEIEDDGQGIDVDLVCQKAVEKGIYSKEQIGKLDENSKLEIIFNDNFSTKNESSLISGRGIGLNAIKYEIDKLQGKIEIDNKKQAGVKFKFSFSL
jgi:two-component system chemotaxis sensor kinase CheA